MFSRFVQNAVRKIVAVPSSSASASASSSLSASAAVVPSFRSTFSTEASTLTPGIGKGKTSTGIVSLIHSYIYFITFFLSSLLLLLFLNLIYKFIIIIFQIALRTVQWNF